MNCHNGNVASKNLSTQFNKTYKHNIFGYTGIHSPDEAALASTKHVECVDCHDPHQSDNNTNVTAPNVKGFNKGVMGINNAGNSVKPVDYEYQICYRCHTTNSWRPSSPTKRQIEQNNVRLEFNSQNPSFHPIEIKGVNTDVPSLISPWTTNSIMYCSHCHSSDGTNAPLGPHGSSYPQILKKQFVKTDPVNYSVSNYALCFDCHSSTSLMSESGPFPYHKKHVQDEKTSCNVCHDPHGVSYTQGNSTNNSKLINFNTDVVSPDGQGRLRYERTGYRAGRCYLKCHNETHSPLSYP